MTSRALLTAVAIAASLFALSCTDPIHDGGVKATGCEVGGVPKGPLHRAGQPCGVCHQESGPAASIFTVSGTIFAQPSNLVGVDQATVTFTDARGSVHTTQTNCVGNFFVRPEEWTPSFPILVRVSKNASPPADMQSQIGRETSCANCHVTSIPPDDPTSQVPHVYLGIDEPKPACDVDPDLTKVGQ